MTKKKKEERKKKTDTYIPVESHVTHTWQDRESGTSGGKVPFCFLFFFLVPVVLFFEKNRPKPVCVSLELSGGYLLGGMDGWMKERMDG